MNTTDTLQSLREHLEHYTFVDEIVSAYQRGGIIEAIIVADLDDEGDDEHDYSGELWDEIRQWEALYTGSVVQPSIKQFVLSLKGRNDAPPESQSQPPIPPDQPSVEQCVRILELVQKNNELEATQLRARRFLLQPEALADTRKSWNDLEQIVVDRLAELSEVRQ